ncbi:MAG: archease, partial [candidate division WOR-3 bacterium]
TADLLLEIFGRDLKELFANAAFALFDCMLEQMPSDEDRQETVALAAADLEELFLDWLRELLFLFATQGLVTVRVDFSELEPTRLRATLYGTDYRPERHGLKLEIKTPTYHQFEIGTFAGGYRAVVLFDV